MPCSLRPQDQGRRADLSWIWPTHGPRRRGILLVILTYLVAWPTLSHGRDKKAHSHIKR